MFEDYEDEDLPDLPEESDNDGALIIAEEEDVDLHDLNLQSQRKAPEDEIRGTDDDDDDNKSLLSVESIGIGTGTTSIVHRKAVLLIVATDSSDESGDDKKAKRNLEDDKDSMLSTSSETPATSHKQMESAARITITSDSEDGHDREQTADDSDRSRSKKNIKGKIVKEKKKRLPTRKEREETMRKIKSQTQKLQREKRVEIPRYQPKQLTLEDFLKRNSNNPNFKKSTPEIDEPILSTIKDTCIPNRKPNLRKIDYLVDLTVEDQFLKKPSISKNINECENVIDIDIEDDEEDAEEIIRQKEIKKIDDIIGKSPSKPKTTVLNWLETNNEVTVEKNVPDDVDGEEIMDFITAPITIDHAVITSEEANVKIQDDELDFNILGSSSLRPKDTVDDTLESNIEIQNQLGSNYLEDINETSLSKPKCPDESFSEINEVVERGKKIQVGVRDRKKTIRDLLKSLPNYKDIAELKPTLKKDSNENFIDLSIDDESSASKIKPSKGGIQKLMDRFIKHSKIPQKPNEEHFNVHFTKKVEDSQGLEHDVIENVEYITDNHNDFDDNVIITTHDSPVGKTPPGSKFRTIQEQLKSQIREKKLIEYTEKMKLHAMYNEEICPEDKSDIEELEDCSSSGSGESEPDETDEEALEEYYNEKDRKTKGRKLEFVDEEAEVDNDDDVDLVDMESVEGDNEMDISENEQNVQSDEEDEVQVLKIQARSRKAKILQFDDSDDEEEEKHQPPKNVIITEKEQNTGDSLVQDPVAKKYCVRITNEIAGPSRTKEPKLFESDSEEWNSDSDKDEVDNKTCELLKNEKRLTPSVTESFFQLKDTTPEILLRPLGLQFYGRRSQQKGVSDGTCPSLISPLKLSNTASNQAFESFLKEMTSKTDAEFELAESRNAECLEVPNDISELINSKKIFIPPSEVTSPAFTQDDDMLGLCSGRFPTQPAVSPVETQYPGFNFTQCDEKQENGEARSFAFSPVTPVIRKDTRGCNDNTPKANEKMPRSRILFRKNAGNDPADLKRDDSDVGDVENSKAQVKKKYTKIHSSGEEDDTGDEFGYANDSNSNSRNKFRDDSNSESEEENGRPQRKFKTDTYKSFKTKSGIRRDFVEDEAELSGSEANSSDEDESDMDGNAEGLLNDDEELNEEIVRAQVERAHLKQLIDDDQKDIERLQERFLENGDLNGYGMQRERQFKWRDLDIIDDEQARMNGLDLAVEDEAEQKWQQEKLEKIKWMKENSHLHEPEHNDEESHKSLINIPKDNSQSWSLRKNTMRKVQTFVSFSQESNSILNEGSLSSKLHTNLSKAFTSTNDDDDEFHFSDINGMAGKSISNNHESPSPQTAMSKQTKRSFLKLGSPMLNAIAGLNKSCELSVAGTKTNSRNFVFTMQSPTEKNLSSTPLSIDRLEEHRNKRKAKFPAKFQPKKIPKTDQAGQANSKKHTSVFKWINAM